MSTSKNKSTYEEKDRSTARIEMKMDLEMAMIRTFMKTILIKEEGRVTTWVRVRNRDRDRDRIGVTDRDRDRDRDRIGVTDRDRDRDRDRIGVRDRDRGF